MKKNVVITVRGLQRQVDEDEPVEVISAGTYLRKDDTHYLSYEEADEDGKLTKNRIKVTSSSVEMTKQGGITTQMIFVEGQKHYACYDTPFGELTLGMTTKSVTVTEENNQISVALRYDLEINDTHMSECELDIEVKECMAG